MLPPLRVVLDAHRFFTLRHHIEVDCADALAEALREAGELASGRTEDEPAALLYALTRHPRALGASWDLFPILFASNHARAVLGAEIRCDPADAALVNLRLYVVVGRVTFEEVRAWVAARLHPMR